MTHNKTNTPHLTFTASDAVDESHPPPKPSNKSLPMWYEMLSSTIEGEEHQFKQTSVKMCMPFGDAIKSGWLLRAPTDIQFTESPDGSTVDGATPDVDNDSVVTTVPVEQTPKPGNSAFLLPNAVIDSQWEIRTPSGYSTLVVPPINRTETRFTAFGLFAETDTETGSFRLPIHVEQTPVTIEEGEPIAQLIPIKRSALLDEPAIRTYSDDDQFGKLKEQFRRVGDVRTGFYRNELWTPKPGGKNFKSHAELNEHLNTTVTDEQPVGPSETRFEEDNRPFLPDDHRHVFYCHEKYAEAIPNPKPAATYIPDGYAKALEQLDIGTNKQQTAEWAIAAMTLGYVIELDRPLHISRNPEQGIEAFHAENEGSNFFHQHLPKKIGSDHSLSPMEILNIFSHWSVVMDHGYSNFYSTPINHFQRDHRSFSGIVDADWHQGEVNIPGKFTERSDEACLDRGTPITQAIPLKRDALLEYAVIQNNAN